MLVVKRKKWVVKYKCEDRASAPGVREDQIVAFYTLVAPCYAAHIWSVVI
jgi:hypothetical protein